MKIRDIKFPEITTEYDYYTFKINNREIKLLYRIRQYRIVKDETLLKNLRKNKVKLKHYRRMLDEKTRDVLVVYYQPYDEKVIDLKYKRHMIDRLLNIEVKEGLTYIQHIESKWEGNGVHKTTDQVLMDKEAISLDILSSYFLGGYEGDNILTKEKEQKIADAECISLDVLIKQETGEKSKEAIPKPLKVMPLHKFKKEMVKRSKRKKSKTDKIFALYSYNDHKNEYEFWDWINQRMSGLDENYHYHIERLIDPEQPYVASWCLVDTENKFTFNDKKYVLDSKLPQYKVYEDNQAEMDKVLVIEQFQQKHYFDENIDPIELKYVA